MASVSYTEIASGTVNPNTGPTGSAHFIWSNVPSAARVHSLWISIQPIGGAGGAAQSEAWVTKASHKVLADPFNRQVHVWFSYTTNVKADFAVLMANVAP